MGSDDHFQVLKQHQEPVHKPGLILFQPLLLSAVGPHAPQPPALGSPHFPSRHSGPSTWSLFLQVLKTHYKLGLQGGLAVLL